MVGHIFSPCPINGKRQVFHKYFLEIDLWTWPEPYLWTKCRRYIIFKITKSKKLWGSIKNEPSIFVKKQVQIFPSHIIGFQNKKEKKNLKFFMTCIFILHYAHFIIFGKICILFGDLSISYRWFEYNKTWHYIIKSMLYINLFFIVPTNNF